MKIKLKIEETEKEERKVEIKTRADIVSDKRKKERTVNKT
jgi:hypothetical protein